MKKLSFKKKQLDPKYPVYQIEQVEGQSIEKVTPGETITFKRIGKDNNWGFEITFDGTPPLPPILVPENLNSNNDSKKDWQVPGTTGTYKYAVSFPYDNTQNEPGSEVEQIVMPLDPVIIINPTFNLSRVVQAVGLVALGAALTYVAMQMF